MPNLLEIDLNSVSEWTAELNLTKGSAAHFLEIMTIVCYFSANFVDNSCSECPVPPGRLLACGE